MSTWLIVTNILLASVALAAAIKAVVCNAQIVRNLEAAAERNSKMREHLDQIQKRLRAAEEHRR